MRPRSRVSEARAVSSSSWSSRAAMSAAASAASIALPCRARVSARAISATGGCSGTSRPYARVHDHRAEWLRRRPAHSHELAAFVGRKLTEGLKHFTVTRRGQTQSLRDKRSALQLCVVTRSVVADKLTAVELPVLRSQVGKTQSAQNLDKVAGCWGGGSIDAVELRPQGVQPAQRMARRQLKHDAAGSGRVDRLEEAHDVRDVEDHMMRYRNIVLLDLVCHVRPQTGDDPAFGGEASSTFCE